MRAVVAANMVKSVGRGDWAGKEKTCGVVRGSSGVLAAELFQPAGQCWDSSQMDKERRLRCDGLACG